MRDKKKKQGDSIRSIEIVTQLWDDDGNPYFDMENMARVLEEKKHCIREWAWIIHDQDRYTAKDEKKNPEHKANTLKSEHIHLIIRFQRDQPQHRKDVAKWFGLAANFLENIRGRWEDGVRYLVHANAPEKFQYDVDEVTANFDVQSVIDSDDTNYLQSVLDAILNGDIREYNKTIEIDNMTLVRYAPLINEAFKVRSEYLQATKLERNTEVIFITGPAGCGKTTLAKKIANERGLAYFVSSGSNDIMDGYGQQPCLIIDDARPSSMGLSDFLKLLDNNTPSSVKSRYKNKYLNCDLIIITTVLSIDNFYHNVFESEKEPIDQLKRRCGTLIQMDPETIYISCWDSAKMKHVLADEFFNTVTKKYIQEPKPRWQMREDVEKKFPFLMSVKYWDGLIQNYEDCKAIYESLSEDERIPESDPAPLLKIIQDIGHAFDLDNIPGDNHSNTSGDNDKTPPASTPSDLSNST